MSVVEPTCEVLLITSWLMKCGISEHSEMLVESMKHADKEIKFYPCDELNPSRLTPALYDRPSIIHLNYQAALHSQWTPAWIRTFQQRGKKVVVTYHDTGVPNSDQCKAIIDAADAAVVHEPFDDLPAEKTHYWRMGVWDPWVGGPPMQLDADGRPILGTIGFPFPWKCYDELCRVTARAGWGIQLLASGRTRAEYQRWKGLNRWLLCYKGFLSREHAISHLAGSDVTAFTYVTHNTGQSGAILLGIAARKPVIALSTCRQFRALYQDPLGRKVIQWCETFEEVEERLHQPLQRVDPGIVALGEQESWRHLAPKYAALYRSLL